MEKTFVFFSDILGQDLTTTCSEQIQALFPEDNCDRIESNGSVFHAIKSHLKNVTSKWVVLVLADIRGWDMTKWEDFFVEVNTNGNAIQHMSHVDIALSERSIQGNVSCYESSDLDMALDQNYRPNFENIYEAFQTFGFKPHFLSVLTDH